jgi:mannan endo-1,4-beta-mannosidase
MQHLYFRKKAAKFFYFWIGTLLFLLVFPRIAEASDIKLEAESATLNGVVVATNRPGFSGAGFVEGFDNSLDKNVTFTFAAKAGIYDLTIRYITPHGGKGYVLFVNGERSEGMFPATTAFASANAGKFLLREGQNTLRIGGGWGWYGIDFISLSPATVALPAKPPKLLVDPQASQATRNLFSYMVDLYGSKVLAAQQEYSDLQEIDFVRTHSGKEPAIGAYDLMDYSPSRLQNGANPNQLSEKAIAWAQKGQGRGIISLMWHWNAPADLINQAPDKLWWSGFYTRATTFDLAAALADKNSERYQLLLRDMDAIAVELKKFQDQNIPVLWRPLHEAAGTWFWWGAKGPAPFIELWQIMYDRLVNHHQLHNLIWVYTAERGKPGWYPGDAYVDVVGVDIYENTLVASNLSGAWTEMQEQFNGKKLVALSETGNLPNPDYIRGFGTWWSWFAVWNGNDFIRKQPTALIHSVFNDPDVLTLDELADWRNYDLVLGNPWEEKTASVSVYPNPTTGGQLHITLTVDQPQEAVFSLVNMVGVSVLREQQSLNPGTNQIRLHTELLASGVYILLIQKHQERITKRVVISQ